MAEIDIQRKSGSNWLWWLLGLIVLALLAWWLLSGMNDRDTADTVADTVADTADGAVGAVPGVGYGATATDSGAGGVITELSALTGADAGSALAGRRVMLAGVPVVRAVSDKGFWAGTGDDAGEGVFVVRGNQSASYTAPDGAVTAGRNVTIYGTVQAMPSDLTQQETSWNLTSVDKARLGQQTVYVAADSVRIAGR